MLAYFLPTPRKFEMSVGSGSNRRPARHTVFPQGASGHNEGTD